MITVDSNHRGWVKHEGFCSDRIPGYFLNSARLNLSELVVKASDTELSRCLMIVTNNRSNANHLAGRLEATFIGDEARKIILNWSD